MTAMDRRKWLRWTGWGGGAAGASWWLSSAPVIIGGATVAAEPKEPLMSAAPNLSPLKITDLRCILTAPESPRLVIVKVLTSEPGLYGLGCATFTQRARVVETAVTKYLRPLLIGKNPLQIEDIWQSSFLSSYWRNGPVLNNAISGVDMALWDILGKRANMPLYQLLGGKCRQYATAYRHASGETFEAVAESAQRWLAQGYRHVRVQVGMPGLSVYGAGRRRFSDQAAAASEPLATFEPAPYVRTVPKLFEYLRGKLGDEVELLHDIHERVPPILAIQLVKDLEKFRPFFVEDPFAPEDVGYFTHLRRQTSTPIAMGELFNNPHEWLPLVSDRLIDFIRCHLSQVGGITMGRKIAALCEFCAVRTAWHGPSDTSPVGHAAQVHLDLACPNFGIQETMGFSQAEQDVFPGCPELNHGAYYANDRPGLGIDLDEKVAARFPIQDDPPFDLEWGNLRRRDGSITRP